MEQTPVLVSLMGGDAESAAERVSLTTPGLLTQTPTGYLLRYTEVQPDGSDSADVSLTVEGTRVIMNRVGDLTTTIVFEKGYPFQGEYRTPYGNLNMNVLAHRVHVQMDEHKGEINLGYQLSLQGTYTSMHDLTIAVRPIQGGASAEQKA